MSSDSEGVQGRLERIRERVETATKGSFLGQCFVEWPGDESVYVNQEAISRFLCSARTDIQYLLSLATAAEGMAQCLEFQVRHFKKYKQFRVDRESTYAKFSAEYLAAYLKARDGEGEERKP